MLLSNGVGVGGVGVGVGGKQVIIMLKNERVDF